jgi:hypothetical protein
MTVATRQARSVVPELPLIPRRNGEARERAQVQYLMWRCGLFLKDAGASHRRRKEFSDSMSTAWRNGESYEQLCRRIEGHMNGFLAKQAFNIQTIFNEK